MSTDTVTARSWSAGEVKSLITEVLGIPADQLEDDGDFVERYGLDSLGVIELLAALERNYRIALPDEKVEKLRTLRGVVDVLTEALGTGPAAA